MFTISRRIEIDAGHRVPFHDSLCRHLHGHRWKIVAHVEAPELVAPDPSRADSGMVVDYAVIKQVLMQEIHDVFDHRLILWEQDPLLVDEVFGAISSLLDVLASCGLEDNIRIVPIIPTSEGLAKYWAELVQQSPNLRDNPNLRLVQLDVWETPNCLATYRLPKNVGVAAQITEAQQES